MKRLANFFLLIFISSMMCACSNSTHKLEDKMSSETQVITDTALEKETTTTWQESYLKIICNIQKYLADIND